jgi:hypothetical protein
MGLDDTITSEVVSKFGKRVTSDTKFTDSIKTLSSSQFENDTTKKRKHFIGEVLRIEAPDSTGKGSSWPFEPGSMITKKYRGHGTPPKIIAIKVRVEEIHSMLPDPEIVGSDPCTPGSKCHHPIIDLHPTFYGEWDSVAIPRVGEQVRVSYRNFNARTDPIYLGSESKYVTKRGIRRLGRPSKSSSSPAPKGKTKRWAGCKQDFDKNPVPMTSKKGFGRFKSTSDGRLMAFTGDHSKIQSPHACIYEEIWTKQHHTCQLLKVPSRTKKDFTKKCRRMGGTNGYASVRNKAVSPTAPTGQGYHNAEDVYTDHGVPIYAPFAGTVIFNKGQTKPGKVQYDSGGGWIVLFQSRDVPGLFIRLLHIGPRGGKPGDPIYNTNWATTDMSRWWKGGEFYKEGQELATTFTSPTSNNMPKGTAGHIHVNAWSDGLMVQPFSAFDLSRLIKPDLSRGC